MFVTREFKVSFLKTTTVRVLTGGEISEVGINVLRDEGRCWEPRAYRSHGVSVILLH